ncbi:hypothetical protein PVAG01_01622 [Phlyctema vagabunda]|uniref:Uncharacterized protein n=1 Tax=Phlyctema vagabunda TaxID=108571 RepID=A0ABR4PXL4_9HELO
MGALDKTRKLLTFYSCYTNHALDQFLEHLVNIGIRQVVRIGGQSKSSILRSKNLKVVSQIIARTRAEGFKLFKSHDALKKNEIASKLLMARLRDRHEELSWEEVKLLVAERYPEVIAQFSPVSKDEHEPVANDLFEEYMKGFVPKEWIRDSSRQEEDLETDSIESIIQEAGTTNVHQFSQKYKTRLLDMWAQELVNDNIQELFETVREADDQRQNIVDIYDEVDRRALETAAVIGVTTTGLARRISVLQHVKSKVVICEEAGEVMEPHLISALLPSCEQLIQIGDHQQLRPKIFNYNLSLESVQGERYQLDRSQFERLSTGSGGLKPPFPVAQLNMQRRMRPEISTLIKQTIYPRLRDHDQVKAYDSVVGMRSPVFWLDHKNVEDGWEMNADQKSKSNQWEVNMIHALVRHIVRQGVYKSSGIAVLTPYVSLLSRSIISCSCSKL